MSELDGALALVDRNNALARFPRFANQSSDGRVASTGR